MQILDSGELTAAAIAMDLDASKASRRIRQLEKEIGVDLLDRSVRPLRPTPAAERLVSHIGVMLEDAVRVQEACRREQAGAPEVLLRMGLSADISRKHLLRHLAAYRHIDESLIVYLESYGEIEDLRSGRLQVAVFDALPQAQDLLVVPITTVFNLPVASPSYVEHFGMPAHPSALNEHILFVSGRMEAFKTLGLWKHFHYGNFFSRRIFRVENETALAAALEGTGIALDLPLYRTIGHLKSGELVPVLNGWHRQCWHYTLACTHAFLREQPAIGNFLEWLALCLSVDEQTIWKDAYQSLGLPFPIDDGRDADAAASEGEA